MCECTCARTPRGGHPVDTPRRFRRSPLKTIKHNGAPLLSLERERSYFIILIYTRATLCLKRGRINGSGARGAFQRDVRERVCILRGLKKPRAWKNARERAILCNGGKGGILPREGWYSLFFLFLQMRCQLTVMRRLANPNCRHPFLLFLCKSQSRKILSFTLSRFIIPLIFS